MGLSPLFYLRDGRPVYPIMGGATDEDPFPNKDKDDNEDDTENEPDDDGGTDDTDDDSDDEDEKPKGLRDARIKELSDENYKRRMKNKELAAQLEKLQKDLKAFTDKDKSDVEKAAGRVTELETAYEDLVKKHEALMKRNAFLSQSKYQFKNPDLALKVVDLSEVEFDDDGKADGLEEVLDALKKSDPYLFKDATSNEDEDAKDSAPKTGDGPKRKDKATVNREALLRKYPALQR